jgi:hypothetical protein
MSLAPVITGLPVATLEVYIITLKICHLFEQLDLAVMIFNMNDHIRGNLRQHHLDVSP